MKVKDWSLLWFTSVILGNYEPIKTAAAASLRFKVTVHVGTDQNIEIKIFAEYKYTLNIVCEIWRTRVFTGSEIVWRAAYFRSEFLETCFG